MMMSHKKIPCKESFLSSSIHQLECVQEMAKSRPCQKVYSFHQCVIMI